MPAAFLTTLLIYFNETVTIKNKGLHYFYSMIKLYPPYLISDIAVMCLV
jgi:hypothetical protein